MINEIAPKHTAMGSHCQGNKTNAHSHYTMFLLLAELLILEKGETENISEMDRTNILSCIYALRATKPVEPLLMDRGQLQLLCYY